MNKPLTASAIRPTKSLRAAKSIMLSRVLMGAMSVAGLLGWCYLTLAALAWTGGGILFNPLVLMLLFGYVYLVPRRRSVGMMVLWTRRGEPALRTRSLFWEVLELTRLRPGIRNRLDKQRKLFMKRLELLLI